MFFFYLEKHSRIGYVYITKDLLKTNTWMEKVSKYCGSSYFAPWMIPSICSRAASSIRDASEGKWLALLASDILFLEQHLKYIRSALKTVE